MVLPQCKRYRVKATKNTSQGFMGQASQNGKEPDLIGYRWNTLKGVSIHDKEEYFFWEEQQMDIFDYLKQ